jgi:hypothetical protein
MRVREFCSFCGKGLAPGAKLCAGCGSVVFRNTSGLTVAPARGNLYSNASPPESSESSASSPGREAASKLSALEESNALEKPEPVSPSGTAKLRKLIVAAISNKPLQKGLFVIALFSIVFIIIIFALVLFQGGADEWLPKTPHRHG